MLKGCGELLCHLNTYCLVRDPILYRTQTLSLILRLQS